MPTESKKPPGPPDALPAEVSCVLIAAEVEFSVDAVTGVAASVPVAFEFVDPLPPSAPPRPHSKLLLCSSALVGMPLTPVRAVADDDVALELVPPTGPLMLDAMPRVGSKGDSASRLPLYGRTGVEFPSADDRDRPATPDVTDDTPTERSDPVLACVKIKGE